MSEQRQFVGPGRQEILLPKARLENVAHYRFDPRK